MTVASRVQYAYLNLVGTGPPAADIMHRRMSNYRAAGTKV